MEYLKEHLDEESMGKLNAEKVTDTSLQDFSMDEIIDMGITEKGPIKVIMKAIKMLNNRDTSEAHEQSTMSNTTNELNTAQQTKDQIVTILRGKPKFNKVLNDLIYGKVPVYLDILKMNRIICNYYFKDRILNQKDYPTLAEKEQLACNILVAFPQLVATRESPDNPIESYFFWKNGGEPKGKHTGIIEWNVGNLRGKVDPENRKFTRPKKPQFGEWDHLKEDADFIAALTPNNQNMKEICEGMVRCQPYLADLVRQGNSLDKLSCIFPHIVAYQGIIVRQMFETKFPQHNPDSNMKKFLLSCLIFDRGFCDIDDREVRAAVRLMKKMGNQGVKRSMSDDMSVSAFMAKPLVVWVSPDDSTTPFRVVERYVMQHPTMEPLIVCVAKELGHGPYFPVVQKTLFPCGDQNFASALEILVKVCAILNITTPTLLKKLFELIKFHDLKIVNSSKLTAVNAIKRILQEAIED